MTDSTIWAKIAAPLPPSAIEWRIDGKPNNGTARFVAYVTAQYVRERLDAVTPGEWSTRLDILAHAPDRDGVERANIKCALTIQGVTREDIGTDKDFKSAATDAFKRAAMRFGIAHELYDYTQNYVPVDEKGRPTVDPGDHYRTKGTSIPAQAPKAAGGRAEPAVAAPSGGVTCPICEGSMFDNRATKRNPKAPDFKCRDAACKGVIWPEKGAVLMGEPA